LHEIAIPNNKGRQSRRRRPVPGVNKSGRLPQNKAVAEAAKRLFPRCRDHLRQQTGGDGGVTLRVVVLARKPRNATASKLLRMTSSPIRSQLNRHSSNEPWKRRGK